MSGRAYRFFLVTTLVGMTGVCGAGAQVRNELERSRYSPAAYYNYSEPGDVTMAVNVWGSVRNPGLYEVPVGTHLSTLLSLAGGPSSGDRRWNQRQTTTIALVRRNADDREMVFEAVMEDEVFVPEVNPVLQEGDVLTVELYTKQVFTWRDALSIVGAGASFALLVDRLLGALN